MVAALSAARRRPISTLGSAASPCRSTTSHISAARGHPLCLGLQRQRRRADDCLGHGIAQKILSGASERVNEFDTARCRRIRCSTASHGSCRSSVPTTRRATVSTVVSMHEGSVMGNISRLRGPSAVALSSCPRRLPLRRPIVRAEAPWPTKPIRFIVPFGLAASTDISMRILAPSSTRCWVRRASWKPPRRAGAWSARTAVTKSAPDGYTLGHCTRLPGRHRAALDERLPFSPRRT